MSAIPNYTGRRVSIKKTGANGIIKETHKAKGTGGVLAVIFLIETDGKLEVRCRPDEVDVLD